MKRTRQAETSRKLFLHLKPAQKPQPVNPNHWSDASKRSVIFTIPPAQYEDIHYQCSHCGRGAVFTATEQKDTFERRKAYIWQQRQLCPVCFRERNLIEDGIRQCQSRWRDHKRELQHDGEFLRRWLSLLERHPEFGARKNYAGIAMLRHRIAKLA